VNILLDTCALVWSISDPSRLGPDALALLQAPDSDVSVSAISAPEIACLVERGRLKLNRPWAEWFRSNVARNRWTVRDVSLDILIEAYSLPGAFHADPADRVLVATARLFDLVLLTSDGNVTDYPHVQTRW